jgi:aryl-alcohol dehydrogenase-like predicted oxidoreductase
MAELRGWSRLVAVQVPYSLANRGVEREILPMARALGLAVTPWGLLRGGELTGKYNSPTNEPRREKEVSEDSLSLAETLMEVAREIGRTPSQVAINWVRQQQDCALMIPILGARTETQIRDNLGCLDFELAPEQRQRLADANPFAYGFPRSFLESEHVRGLIHGKTFALVDNHRAY